MPKRRRPPPYGNPAAGPVTITSYDGEVTVEAAKPADPRLEPHVSLANPRKQRQLLAAARRRRERAQRSKKKAQSERDRTRQSDN